MKIFLLFLLINLFITYSYSQSLRLDISDYGGEEIHYADIELKIGTTVVSKIHGNSRGEYSIYNLSPGTYNLEVHCIGYTPIRIENVVIENHNTTWAELKLGNQCSTLVISELLPNPFMLYSTGVSYYAKDILSRPFLR